MTGVFAIRCWRPTVEDGSSFGKKTKFLASSVCFVPNHGNRSLGAEVALELTRDALIDFCVSRHDEEQPAATVSRLVSLPAQQDSTAPELRSV